MPSSDAVIVLPISGREVAMASNTEPTKASPSPDLSAMMSAYNG